MYSVMIVDDEPPFIRNVTRFLEKYSHGFIVIAQASNGMEAFEKIPQNYPDIIFTDIKMPILDGIALTKKVRESFPEIFIVIISGYSDFEFAREALKSGAEDYLLKPLEIDQFTKITQSLHHKLGLFYQKKALFLIDQALRSIPVDRTAVNRYLKYDYYFVVVARLGALPGRIQAKSLRYEPNIFSEFQSNEYFRLCSKDDSWVIEGKDECEGVFLFGLSQISELILKCTVDNLFSFLSTSMNNFTLVFSPYFCDINHLTRHVQDLRKILHMRLVIGKNQSLYAKSYNLKESNFSQVDSGIETRLATLIQSRSMSTLKNEILKIFQNWEHISLPQVYVEQKLKRIFQIIGKYATTESVYKADDLEDILDEVIYFSVDFGGLLRCIWEMIEDALGSSNQKGGSSKPSEDLFNKILSYIHSNLPEPLTIQVICSIYGISQPYLSRLFRKFKGVSFIEYLTTMRIDNAKRLIIEQPEMNIKDVAKIVGYQDQHYFSKVFKSVVGCSPSDFREI